MVGVGSFAFSGVLTEVPLIRRATLPHLKWQLFENLLLYMVRSFVRTHGKFPLRINIHHV